MSRILVEKVAGEGFTSDVKYKAMEQQGYNPYMVNNSMPDANKFKTLKLNKYGNVVKNTQAIHESIPEQDENGYNTSF